MDINEAIARHPNLLNNYRRAAMCLVQADKMRERNEFNETRDTYLINAGHYLGRAQGWLYNKYSITIDGTAYTYALAKAMSKETLDMADIEKL